MPLRAAADLANLNRRNSQSIFLPIWSVPTAFESVEYVFGESGE